MRFGFLKRKNASPNGVYLWALGLKQRDFVEFVADLICKSEPAAATMCLVALQNLSPMFDIVCERARELPDKGLPTDVDSFIRFLSNSEPIDEIGRRRTDWFLWALMVRRATELAEHNEDFRRQAASIWSGLARGGQYLQALLEENVIWSDSEKEWFAHIVDQTDGAQYVLNHMIPKWLRWHADVVASASSLKLHKIFGAYRFLDSDTGETRY